MDSWWIWSGIQDYDEFKRLIEAHAELGGEPLNEHRANTLYKTAMRRSPQQRPHAAMAERLAVTASGLVAWLGRKGALPEAIDCRTEKVR